MPKLALWIAAALLLAGCGSQTEVASKSAKEAPAAASSSAPASAATADPDAPSADLPKTLDFSGTTVDGAKFDGASLLGKPTVLWFWAPWCPTCQGQAPNVSALAKEYADQVNVVGVAGLSDSDSEIKAFADNTSGVTNLSDSPGEIWRKFGIVEQSVYVVLDADGKVVKEGGYLEDSALNDLVASLV
jgi:thiol-disulfide isomerase/thioredoxin